MSTVAFFDANGVLRYLDVNGTGTTNDPFVLNFAAFNELAASDYNQSTAGFIALLRLLGGTVGTVSDTANADGSLMARMRLQSKSISAPNIFSRYQTSATNVINASASYVVCGWVHNRNAGLRYLQIFDRITTPSTGTVPIVSYPVNSTAITRLTVSDFCGGSSNGLLCPTGLAWGFSSTEGTYTAGAAADVSVTLFWRPA